MPDIFQAQIAEQINQALGPLVFGVTLVKHTPGTRTNSTGGTNPTTANHVCRGFIDDYNSRRIDGSIIRQGDRVCTILGASLPAGIVPEPNDSVIAESQTRTIVSVVRDPAGATYECQIR